jgi:hypothetical protein
MLKQALHVAATVLLKGELTDFPRYVQLHALGVLKLSF